MSHDAPVDPLVVIFVIAITLLASIGQSFTGFGFGLTVVPVFVLVLNVHDTVVVSTLLGLANVALLALRVWQSVPWLTVGRVLAGSVSGMPLGLAILVFAPEDVLRLGVGMATIAMAGALASGLRITASGAATEVAVGLTSGVLRTSTSMSGPPLVIYLHGHHYPREQFRAALTMYFLIGSLVSVGAFFGADVVTGDALLLAAAALPAVYAGSWTGDRLLRRVDPSLFRRLVLVLLIATALTAIGSSIHQLAT